MQNFGPQPVVAPPGQHEQFRPPLANQLFENRSWFIPIMSQFGEFGDFRSLVTSLRACDSVERRLAEIQQEADVLPIRHCQLAAICYYIQSVIWQCEKNWYKHHVGITNHSALFEMIELWRHRSNEKVCVVTFNYDTLIEKAMEQVLKATFNEMSQYVSDQNYKLIKLHGSIDWGREVSAEVGLGVPAHVVHNAAKLQISDRYRKVSRPNAVFEDGSVGYPAIAVPVEKKSEFVCPELHLSTLANLIPSVSKIVTIGWRAMERHFLDMLTKRLTGLQGDVDLMIVSGSDSGANDTLKSLAIGPPNSERKRALRGDGFSGLLSQVGRGHLEHFLR